jgi:hypothetical protein
MFSFCLFFAASALATEHISMKPTKAITAAPGSSFLTVSQSGLIIVNRGHPEGTRPTTLTGFASSFSLKK